jgi:hypothetical protein
MRLEYWKVHGLTVSLHVDEDCSSPRDYDNLGTMVAWHRRFCLGDTQPRETPDEWMDDFRATNADWRSAVMLPVYMHEHGNVALAVRDFGDPWDSGQVGWIYALPAQIRKAYRCTRISARVRAEVAAVLRSEVDTYGRYVNGECYGYVIEDASGDTLDSCWGFIGYAYAREAADEAAHDCAIVEQP